VLSDASRARGIGVRERRRHADRNDPEPGARELEDRLIGAAHATRASCHDSTDGRAVHRDV